MPFSAGMELGHCTAPIAVFIQPYGKNDHLGPFLWFQEYTPIQNESEARKQWYHIVCAYIVIAGYDVIA